MFKNLKKNWYDRKIQILNFVYRVYKYRSKTEENIQSYAKQISRSVAYEKIKYKRVLDYGEESLFVGYLCDDSQSKPESTKKDE